MRAKSFVATLLFSVLLAQVSIVHAQVLAAPEPMPAQAQPQAQVQGQAADETQNAEPSNPGTPNVEAGQQPALSEPNGITGSVQMTQPAQPAALSAADYLDVQAQPGESKYDMQEFSVQLHNKQSRHVEVLQLEVVNGIDEQAYIQMQQVKAQKKRKAAGGLLRGLGGVASIASGFIPYAGMGSVVAYQAIGAGTQAAYLTANAVDATAGQGGAVDYSGRVIQRANNIFISPNQQFQCQAVVPQNQQPVVRVVFKDLQTNQIFDIRK